MGTVVYRPAYLLVLLLLGVHSTPVAAWFTDRVLVGGLRSVSGQTVIVREGREIFARTGMRVYKTDLLRTGAEASLAIVLLDDTRIAVGPGTEISLDHYAAGGDGPRPASSVTLLKGTAQYITGSLARAAPAGVEVRTPVSTIGIRGTRIVLGVD